MTDAPVDTDVATDVDAAVAAWEVSRDEVEQRITRAVDDWDEDDVAAVVAAKLRAELEEECPEHLVAWLAAHAEVLLATEIRRRLKPTGTRKGRSPGAAFQGALVVAASTDLDDLAMFDHEHVIDGEKRTVADMTGDDHLEVAARYQTQATTDVMLAAFHRAIAKVLGKRRTADVMDEDQYAHNLREYARRMCGS